MEWIKELLKNVVEESKIDEVIQNFNKEFPKHAVPKTEFNETREELKTTKTSLTETKELIDKLNKESGSLDEYKGQIETLQNTLNEKEVNFNSELSSIKKKTAYKELLMKSNVNDAAVDLLVQTASFDNINLTEDGKISDSDKLINSLKETKASLFNVVNTDGHLKDEQYNNDHQKSDADLTMAERFEKMGIKPLNKRYT